MRSDAVVEPSLRCEVEDAFERKIANMLLRAERHGHDDDAVISPTTSIPGLASLRARIDRVRGMTVHQAIRLQFYTLERDETAWYIRLVRATGEGDPDTIMRNAEVAEIESDRSSMISDTDVRNPVDDFSD